MPGRPGRRLGIGVVGAGRWAHLAHLPGWARDPRCQLIGVCDTEPGRAQAAAREFGAAVATPDYRELLSRDDIDIIDVVTRDGEHFEINCAAIEAGKHVLASEVLGEAEGNEGNFADGLWVQEVVNAVEISHHERRWVDLPLEDGR